MSEEKYSENTNYSSIMININGPFGERDNVIINHAIQDLGNIKSFEQSVDKIDKDLAILLNIYQGICVRWIFKENIDILKIEEIIVEGLDYFRLKYDIIGYIPEY